MLVELTSCPSQASRPAGAALRYSQADMMRARRQVSVVVDKLASSKTHSGYVSCDQRRRIHTGEVSSGWRPLCLLLRFAFLISTAGAQWESDLPQMPTSRSKFTLLSVEGADLWAFGGWPRDVLNSVEKYSVVDSFWKSMPPMLVGRSGATAFSNVAESKLFIMGGVGEDGTSLGTASQERRAVESARDERWSGRATSDERWSGRAQRAQRATGRYIFVVAASQRHSSSFMMTTGRDTLVLRGEVRNLNLNMERFANSHPARLGVGRGGAHRLRPLFGRWSN